MFQLEQRNKFSPDSSSGVLAGLRIYRYTKFMLNAPFLVSGRCVPFNSSERVAGGGGGVTLHELLDIHRKKKSKSVCLSFCMI